MTRFTQPLPRDARLAERLRERLAELEPDDRRKAEGLLRWWEAARAFSSPQRRRAEALVA